MQYFKNRYSAEGRTRTIVLAMVAACLTCVLTTTAWSQVGTLSFDPPVSEIDCHESVTIDVNVDAEIVDLHGFSLVFEFDPDVLEVFSVSPGSLLDDADCGYFLEWVNETAVGDSIWVDSALLGCSVDGPGTIVQIVLGGHGPGVSNLGCRTGLLRDSLNMPIPYVCGEAEITNLCPTETTRSVWGYLKCIFH